MRIPWDEYFMLIAKLVSTRSTCLKRRVGAVIVKDKRILATGYNGQLSGLEHCDDAGECFKDFHENPAFCRAVHAEANAILQSAKQGISLKGADLYCTLKPCADCLKMIASVGIRRVLYEMPYYIEEPELDRFWHQEAREAGVEIRQHVPGHTSIVHAQEALNPWTSAKRKN